MISSSTTAARLVITDGTITIDLLGGASSYSVDGWRQAIAQHKGGGVWQSSPLSDGKRLVGYNYDNVRQTFPLCVGTGSADLFARKIQDLQRLLEKAADYWATTWQNEPVWIEKRTGCEEGTLYAYIQQGAIAELDDQFESRFPADASMPDLLLDIWHTHWQDHEPEESTCVQLEGTQPFTSITGQTTVTSSPAAGADDAWAYSGGASWTTASVTIPLGYWIADATECGIRFPNVALPNGADVLAAYVTFTCRVNGNLNDCLVRITGEDADNAAQFTTYEDFRSRTRTDAFVNWPDRVPGIGAWTTPNTYNSYDITNIIQEIVDRPGWASGNAIVTFFDDNGSTPGAVRDAASWDDPALAPPQLTVIYTTADVNYGRAATCEDEVYVANRANRAQITDAYRYDSSAGAWSGNLVTAGLPYNLMPNPVGNQDCFIFGCRTALADSGPFGSVVFDIGTPATYTGTANTNYKYWNGAWAVIRVNDNTTSATDKCWDKPGVNSIHWNQPSDWVVGNLNTIYGGAAPNVDGYWFQIESILGTGAIGVATQQNREIYSIVWDHVDIDAAQVPGDIYALARTVMSNRSDRRKGAANTTPYLWINRVIMGLRSVSRGDDFRAFINFADEQNNPTGLGGVLASAGTNTTIVTDTTAPAGRSMLWNPTGVEAMLWRASAVITNPLAGQYAGYYRVFLRARQSGGVAGDVELRLVVKRGGVPIHTTQPQAFTHLNEWHIFDFGGVLVELDTIAADDYSRLSFTIEGSTSSGTPNIYFYDLCLMPADEYIGDFEDTARDQNYTILNKLSDNLWTRLDVDSTYHPDRVIQAVRKYAGSSTTATGHWLAKSAQPNSLANGRDQRLYFLFLRDHDKDPDSPEWRAEPGLAVSLQSWRVSRFLGLRGDQ